TVLYGKYWASGRFLRAGPATRDSSAVPRGRMSRLVPGSPSQRVSRFLSCSQASLLTSSMAIGSHIIPKFYLEQFAVPSTVKDKPGRLWVYEKGQEPDERATSVQGKEKGYFGIVAPDGTLDEKFETRLAEMEADCNSTLVFAKSFLFDLRSTLNRN